MLQYAKLQNLQVRSRPKSRLLGLTYRNSSRSCVFNILASDADGADLKNSLCSTDFRYIHTVLLHLEKTELWSMPTLLIVGSGVTKPSAKSKIEMK